ncbi:MAG: TlpA family protein disulfide reductase [Bacillota bacterium]
MLRMFLFFACVLPMVSFAGDKLPEIVFKDLPGKSINQHAVNFAELEGHIVVVDFWASWCEPCKAALPHYNKLAEKFKGKVIFIGINEDDSSAARDGFLQTTPLNFPVFADAKKKMADDFKVLALPTLYVLDKKLKPISYYRGFDDKKMQVLEKSLAELAK